MTTACLAAVASGLTLRRRHAVRSTPAPAGAYPVLTPEAEAA